MTNFDFRIPLLGSLLLAGSPLAAQAADPIVMNISCYSGAYAAAFKQYVIPQFEKDHNVKIVYSEASSEPTLTKLQAQKASPQIDLACVSSGISAKAKKLGLLEKNDPAIVTNAAKLRAYAKDKDDIGIAWGTLAMGISYDPEQYKNAGLEPPKSWNDLLNPKNEGHLSFSDFTGTYGPFTLIMMAKANGGSQGDIDPGFKAMADMSKLAVTIAGTDFTQLYSQKEIWVAPWANSDVSTVVKKTGLPLEFVFPTEGSPAIITNMAVVKNAPNPELAQEFLNYMLSPEVQAIIANDFNVAPTVDGLDLPKDLANKVGYSEEYSKRLMALDYDKLAADLPAWTQRWLAEVQK
jgi:putative spermidine/putrescine transport system substrate-binding protein